MRIPPHLRAFVFDFDGVLVDSEPLHMWAIQEAVWPRGWTFSREQFFASIVGKGDENAFHLIAKWHGASVSPAAMSAFLEVKQGHMRRGIEERRFTVQPGAAEAVRAAHARFDGRIAVCSGSRAGVVVPLLEATGLRELFEFVITHESVVKPKPDPEGYLLAAERLGARVGATGAIEDTPSGVAAAKAAGLWTVAVAHTVVADRLNAADAVLPRIADIEF